MNLCQMGISIVHKSKYCLHLRRIMIFFYIISILICLASSPDLKDELFKFLTAKIGITILALIQNIKFFIAQTLFIVCQF